MNPQPDEILEGLRPRMRQARVGHVRRMVAGLALVPLIAVAAVATTVDRGAQSSVAAAGSPSGDGDAPEIVLPDIGDGDVAERNDLDDGGDGADGGDASIESVEQTKVLSLGPLGDAEVSTGGGLALVETNLADGWSIHSVDAADDALVIVVKRADQIKIITITKGVRGELDVRVDDLVIPTTTTTTTTTSPPTTTTKKAETPAPVVDRFEVVVEGKGSFIVERAGDTLWAGNVTAYEGYDFEVVQGTGWKVYVRFTNGEWDWYGKAFINDHGQVEKHFWDEAPPFEPVFQWVEVPEVGAVKFKLWSDGLVYVKDHETAAGVEFWDDNEGQPGEVAKINFEADGALWIVEAWGNDDGGLSWSVSEQATE